MTQPSPLFRIKVNMIDRQLPPDMVEWLVANVGPIYDIGFDGVIVADGWDSWNVSFPGGTPWERLVTFNIKDLRKATMFKLAWGGV